MRSNSVRPTLSLFLLLFAGTLLPAAQPVDRLSGAISEGNRITLQGNTHPAIANAAGAAPLTPLPMERMVLVLKADASQDAALEQLIAQQHDPKSSQFHKFLTPGQFAKQFGVSDNDIQTITSWLTSHGFHIDEIPAGHRSIVFSGNSDQVASAFRTEIKQFTVNNQRHYANASDPQIPASLAQVVHGVLKLHDFRHSSSVQKMGVLGPANAAPQFTYGSSHYLAPPDFATIYDVNPLYSNGIDGTGQNIAIVARSNINLSDVQSFRSQFGLPTNQPQVTIVNSDPGLTGDVDEATLDTEWSGAVAPRATVNLVVAASTNTADGVDLSAQYIVNNNVAPVMSVSYGSCEYYMGSSEMSFYNGLWKQAAAQGISVFVSAGDSGASGCDSGGSSSGSGRAINGLCSSPYSTCVGGTEFNEGSNPGQYWLPGNNSVQGSATGYIPEAVWNESGNSAGGSGLWSGGGGSSIYYTKPSWQSAPGVPADGVRDVPDVSLDAAIHDGYLIVDGGNLVYIGGTSASSPSFAGLMALVDQKVGARQGCANTNFYPLAVKQASGGAAIFHDITTGNNSVPGVNGYSAVAGYDLATGLGTVDADLLVTHWTDTTVTTPGLSLLTSQSNLILSQGQTSTVTLTSSPLGQFNAAVSLAVGSLPSGLTATLASSTIGAPGSGKVVLTIAASKTLAFGIYTFNVTAQGGGITATAPITVTLQSTGNFTVATTTNYFISGQGNTRSMNIMLTPSGGFNSPVSVTIPGLPTGVTMTAPTTTLSGTATATVPLTFVAAQNAATGVYQLLVTNAGGGITKTFPLQLTVTGASDCTLASNPSGVTMNAGDSANIEVYCGNVKGNFSDVLQLAVSSNKPAGVTIQQLRMQAVPGNPTGNTTLAITSANTAAPGTYAITVNATTPLGFSQTINIPFVINAPSTLLVTSSAPSVTVLTGQTAQVQVTTKHSGNFNSAVQLLTAGFPAGVTATLSQSSIAAPGDATVTVNISAATTTAPGTKYYFVLAAEAGNQSFGVPIGLVVAPGPNFTLTETSGTTTIVQGKSALVGTVYIGGFVNGFNSPVALSASGMPAGMTATFAKPTLTGSGASSALTMAIDPSTAIGVYPIRITGSGGGVTQTGLIYVTVSGPPNFNFTAAASSTATVIQGNSINAGALSIGGFVNGFNSSVALGASGLPTGMTASFAKTSLSGSGASTALTLSAAKTTATGAYTITVTGTGGGLTKTATLSVTVAPAPTFTLSATAVGTSVVQGNTLTAATLTITPLNGFNSPVSLTLTGLPGGMTPSIAAISAGSPTANLTLATTKTVAAGSYTVTITATGGGITQTAKLPITVASAPTFTLKATAAASSVVQGNTLTAGSLAITPLYGFNAPVTLNVSGLPTGMTAAFASSSLGATAAATNLTLATAPATTPGKYTLTITAIGGGITQATTLSITVAAAPSFTLKATTAGVNVVQGNTLAAGTLAILPLNGFNSPVSLAISGLPTGMTATFGSAALSTASNTTNLTLNTAKTVAPGSYPLTVTAIGGGITQTSTFAITVAAAPSFTLSAASAATTLAPSTAVTVGTVSIGSFVNFNAPVSLTVSGLPKGMTATFGKTSLSGSGASTTLTLTASTVVASGNYTITVTATGAGVTQTTTLPISITAAASVKH